MRSFEVVFRALGPNRVIECERITWLNSWVQFTTEGYLNAAYPYDLVYAIFETDLEHDTDHDHDDESKCTACKEEAVTE